VAYCGVLFSCIPFVLSERGVKMAAPLDVYTKDEQLAVVRFCGLKE
jgi:hypothetical protein